LRRPAARRPRRAGELRPRRGARDFDTEAERDTGASGPRGALLQRGAAARAGAAASVGVLSGGATALPEPTLTLAQDAADFGPTEPGRNVWFGVREHAMGAAANGIAYHGGFIPYVGAVVHF